MTVENAPRLSIRRPNALVVKGDQQEQYIAFESKEERDDWAKVRAALHTANEDKIHMPINLL